MLYLAWRYLAHHRIKSVILLTAITLILYVPIGLRVLVKQSAEQLTARAVATPLLLGASGSPLELVLSSLYFGADPPPPIGFEEAQRARESGLASAIPLHARFASRGHPIVGTSIDYFEFRGLRPAAGRLPAILGECVVGSRVARAQDVGPGSYVVSSPENVFDLAGVYPLKMRVAGVLAPTGTADDDAIFVDVKTSWVIEGLGHGHADLAQPEAAGGVLSRDGNRVTANASVVQYNEITEANLSSFHFHGALDGYPLTAVIVVPADAKAAALLQGRYEASADGIQVVRPVAAMNDLLSTVLTVEEFVTAGAVLLGASTVATMALVFLLSLRLRRREIETLVKIGGSPLRVRALMASEMVAVVVAGISASAGLTLLTGQLAPELIRTWLRM